MVSGWHAQSRDILRAQLAIAATDIFAADGFDQVTVEALVQRLGISRATFFRYFASKDEAVLATLEASDGGYAEMLDAFDRIEVAPDESVWRAVVRTLGTVASLRSTGLAPMRRRVQMIMATPSLRTRFQEDRRAREAHLAAALDRSLGDPLAAEVAAAAALGALDVAWRIWAADSSNQTRFVDVLADAIGALERAGEARSHAT